MFEIVMKEGEYCLDVVVDCVRVNEQYELRDVDDNSSIYELLVPIRVLIMLSVEGDVQKQES